MHKSIELSNVCKRLLWLLVTSCAVTTGFELQDPKLVASCLQVGFVWFLAFKNKFKFIAYNIRWIILCKVHFCEKQEKSDLANQGSHASS